MYDVARLPTYFVYNLTGMNFGREKHNWIGARVLSKKNILDVTGRMTSH